MTARGWAAWFLVPLAACAPSELERVVQARVAEEEVPVVVPTQWLADRLEEADLLILHAGGDPETYLTGHIPGARFIGLGDLQEERDGVPNLLRPLQELRRAVEQVGVSEGARVVVYDDGSWLPAARTFFVLEYLGHDAVSVLDGGLTAWRSEGRALAQVGEVPVVELGSLDREPRPERVLDAQAVARILEAPGFLLVDARPAAQYGGEEPGAGVPRPGHIPGAVNIFWEETLAPGADSRLREREALEILLREAGLGPADTLVAYCRTGMQASHLFLVGRHLGREGRLYDGSFVDWSRRETLPVSR